MCRGIVRSRATVSFRERKLRKILGRLKLFAQCPSAENARVLSQKVYNRQLANLHLSGDVLQDIELVQDTL